MNKINFKFLISIFLISFSFMACGEDDENKGDITKTNHFLYEGKEYPLNEGWLTFYGRGTGFEAFDIVLDFYSSGIKTDSNNDNLSGKGELMGIGFYSSAENELSSGTYTFNANSTERNAFTFVLGITYIDVDTGVRGGGDDVKKFLTTEGSVKVNKTGEVYEFDIDFTLDNGKKITGYYKGEMREDR